MLSFFSHFSHHYLYIVIFLLYIPLGGLVLIPTIYLAIYGTLNVFFVYMAIILSSATADSIWYYIGRHHVNVEKIYKIRFIQSKIEEAKNFSHFFTKHGVLLVFFTKFIAGTRLTSHILAGAHKVNYFKFLGATALGSTFWFILFYILIKSLDMSVANVGDLGKRIQIIFLAAAVILLLVNYIAARIFRNKILKKKRAKTTAMVH